MMTYDNINEEKLKRPTKPKKTEYVTIADNDEIYE
jgi:hypothetical protein